MSLLTGFNHVAVLTCSLDRFVTFYSRVFELEVVFIESTASFRHAILRIGKDSWLHPVEIPGNPHALATTAMFNRGHLDHLALCAASREAFENIRHRLVESGATDNTVEELGPFQSLWFEDPDGMRGEVTLIINPTLQGIHEPRPLA
jgi:catechol 2,3-dioxygenase-like lactoylglutathione lyase family enzyme